MGTLHDYEKNDKIPFPLIRASATIKIPVQSEVRDLVRGKLHGLVVIQPEPKLFDKHETICSNGVAQVGRYKMFWLLIDNFANQSRQVLTDQVVASALINRTCLKRSTPTRQEVLGIVNERTTTGLENNETLRFQHK